MKLNYLFELLFFCAYLIPVQAQFNYLPAKIGDHQIVKHGQYTLSYNEANEQADWVAYELTSAEASASGNRCDCFKKDTAVKTGSAKPEDYASTGFDKGHLTPSADNYISDTANAESFLMSNISPQLPGLNRGLWADLEDWVRRQALIYNRIYVVTGPVFINDLGKLGSDSVTIPGYFYKVLLRFNGSKVKTIAFLIPQVGATGTIKDYIVPVNTIETLTGIDFFPALNNSAENKIESQYEPGQWGL